MTVDALVGSLLDTAVRDPESTLRRATRLLDSGLDAERRGYVWQAIALASGERGEPDEALHAARQALTLAERPPRVAELRLLVAWIEQDRGRTAASMRQLDAAQPVLRGALLARAHCLRGLNLCVAGDHRAAHRELTVAITGLRRHADEHWLGNALAGRGVVRSYLLRLAAAETDLADAERLFAGLGEPERAATCRHNRGFVALQAGDLPRALDLFDQAVRAGLRVRERAEALLDRATAMLAAGLHGDAGAVLERAAAELESAGRGLRCADAFLAIGQCALRAGRPDLAGAAARRAAERFRAQRRTAWLAVADSVVLRAGFAAGRAPVSEAIRLAGRCERHGWPLDAAELRLAAAGAATAGRGTARRLLRRVQAHRHTGPARLRALGWLARAHLAALDGKRVAVLAACRAGLRVVDRSAAALGSPELRAGASELAAELAGAGLAAALHGARPATVLDWAERHRAIPRRAGVPREQLVAALGDAVLASFVEHRGRLAACSVAGGRIRWHELADAEPVYRDVEALRFACGLLARARSAAGTTARLAAECLDHALLAPLRRLLGDRPLVVVPTGGLHGLPWSALPACAGRPVSVAPSAAAWLAARQAGDRSPGGAPVWVAGPGMRHAEREVRLLQRRFGGTVLTGEHATVAATLAEMEGAGVVHVAAHGRFRSDAPMFSGLELADGVLHGYELDRLRRAPGRVVLSACEGGRSALRCGEPVGLATVLLCRGTSALVASTVPVPDAATADLVLALHTHLHTGRRPAEALAMAQREHDVPGFVCLGAG